MNDQDKARWNCFVCPVQKECGEYFTRTKSKFGIWGGRNTELDS